jgi:hypothetical protein
MFFLIAGLSTPASIAHKGRWRYARDRLVRLGVPVPAARGQRSGPVRRGATGSLWSAFAPKPGRVPDPRLVPARDASVRQASPAQWPARHHDHRRPRAVDPVVSRRNFGVGRLAQFRIRQRYRLLIGTDAPELTVKSINMGFDW